mgnify:CR=1 FL=1
MAKVEGIYDEKGILREVFPHIFRTEVSMLQDLCEVKKRLLELKGELSNKNQRIQPMRKGVKRDG